MLNTMLNISVTSDDGDRVCVCRGEKDGEYLVVIYGGEDGADVLQARFTQEQFHVLSASMNVVLNGIEGL